MLNPPVDGYLEGFYLYMSIHLLSIYLHPHLLLSYQFTSNYMILYTFVHLRSHPMTVRSLFPGFVEAQYYLEAAPTDFCTAPWRQSFIMSPSCS